MESFICDDETSGISRGFFVANYFHNLFLPGTDSFILLSPKVSKSAGPRSIRRYDLIVKADNAPGKALR